MEYKSKNQGLTDSQLQDQIMATRPSYQTQTAKPVTTEDLLAITVEEQQKAALANYHLRMQDAGAIVNPKTGAVDPNTIEPAIAQFAAAEYTANMTKIAEQREKLLNNFTLVQNEDTLTDADKTMVQQQMMSKERWPVHMAPVTTPRQPKPVNPMVAQEKLRKDYSDLLDKASSYQENAMITKGRNHKVPLALLNKDGSVARAATPAETVEYLAVQDAIQKHPFTQKYSGNPSPAQSADNTPWTQTDALAEYKNLGGSKTPAGKEFGKKFSNIMMGTK